MASRDRLKLDERWNFAHKTAAESHSHKGEIPREGDFCRPGGERLRDGRQGLPQLPDKLKTCRHEGGDGEPGGACLQAVGYHASP
jgi:hypothetical protein